MIEPEVLGVINSCLCKTCEKNRLEGRRIHLHNLLGQIHYKNWDFRVGPLGNGHFLQVVLDTKDDKGENWKGRKWYVSPHMIDSEIVATAFRAVLTAEEHEAREQFLFDGAAIYGPHLSLDALLANADGVAIR